MALLLPVGLAWVALPSVARWVVVRQLEAMTGRGVSVERFELDIAGGRLGIGGFRLADREPGPPLAEFERLEVRFRPRALLRRHVHVTEATLTTPRVRIVRAATGALNIADLLGPPEARERGIAVTVDRFRLAGGMVTLEDRTRTPARAWPIEAIAVEATGLSTVGGEMTGSGRLTATVAGGPASADLSELRLFPTHARARVVLQGVDAALAEHVPSTRRAGRARSALVSTTLDGRLDAGEGVRVDGQGRLEDVVLRQPEAAAPFATVPALAFTAQSGSGPSGRLSLSRLEISATATLFDVRGGTPTRYEIDRLRLLVDGSAGPDAPARVSVTAGLPGGGDLDVQGPVRFAPLGAQLQARVKHLDLVPWAALVPPPLRLTGLAEADVAIDVTRADRLVARIRGQAAATRVGIGQGSHDIARADQVELTGVDAEWPRLRVGRVRVVRPAVILERDPAGRIALPRPLTSPGPPTPPAAPTRAAAAPAPAPPALAVDLDEVVVVEGTLALRDVAVAAPAPLQLSAIRLAARGLAWPARAPAKLDLTAKTPGAGTLTVEGSLSLDPGRLDVRARLADVALAPYQPYVPAGGTIQGRLDADVTVAGSLGERPSAGVQGTLSVNDLSLSEGPRSMVTVARLETTGLDYAWPGALTIDRLRIQKPTAAIERKADGTVPLAALFVPARGLPAHASPPEPARAPAPDAARVDASPPLRIAIREAVVEGGGATLVDGAVNPAARLAFAGIRLVARDVAWPARGPTGLELEAPMPGGGRLTARGQLNLAAPSRDASLQVVLNDVALAPVQPYVPVRGRVSGQVSGDLEVKVALDPVAVTARGTASLVDLAVADGDRPLLTVGRLETSGLDYTSPARVGIDRVRVQKSWARIERTADGAFTLRALFRPKARCTRADGAPVQRCGRCRPAGAGADRHHHPRGHARRRRDDR